MMRTRRNPTSFSPAERILFADKVLAHRAEQRGKLEGALEFATKLLTERFGSLSPDVMARLQAATKTELEDIGVRVLRAATLEEALGTSKRRRK